MLYTSLYTLADEHLQFRLDWHMNMASNSFRTDTEQRFVSWSLSGPIMRRQNLRYEKRDASQDLGLKARL